MPLVGLRRPLLVPVPAADDAEASISELAIRLEVSFEPGYVVDDAAAEAREAAEPLRRARRDARGAAVRREQRLVLARRAAAGADEEFAGEER